MIIRTSTSKTRNFDISIQNPNHHYFMFPVLTSQGAFARLARSASDEEAWRSGAACAGSRHVSRRRAAGGELERRALRTVGALTRTGTHRVLFHRRRTRMGAVDKTSRRDNCVGEIFYAEIGAVNILYAHTGGLERSDASLENIPRDDV